MCFYQYFQIKGGYVSRHVVSSDSLSSVPPAPLSTIHTAGERSTLFALIPAKGGDVQKDDPATAPP